MRLGGNRALTLQVNAINLLNTVQWASVDTNVNSPTFGQVLSVRPMRTVTVNCEIQVLTCACTSPTASPPSLPASSS